MISYPRPATTAQLLGYFVKESQGYSSWTEHPEFHPEFGGSLLPVLGLKAGPFTEDEYTDFCLADFPAVLSGNLKIAYDKESDRAAYDITVAPPKDFSLQLLVSNDKRFYEAARDMNRQVMAMFEKYCLVRITDEHGRTQKVRVQGIAYATWWHISSRERHPDSEYDVGSGGNPHFHAHNLVSRLVLPRGSETLAGMQARDIQVAARAMGAVDDGDTDRALKKMAGAAKKTATSGTAPSKQANT